MPIGTNWGHQDKITSFWSSTSAATAKPKEESQSTTQALSEHQVSEKKRKATEILIQTEKINMVRDNCDTF